MKAITLIHRRKPAYFWTLKWKFKIQDFWVGVFWKSLYNFSYESCSVDKAGHLRERVTFDLYICLIPCMPLHFGWRHIHKENRRDTKPVPQGPRGPDQRAQHGERQRHAGLYSGDVSL